MPAFFTSRIYIDLSEEADFARGFEQLLRWCFDKPLYVEPELGEAPASSDGASLNRAIDLDGRTLMPGLIDAHAHLSSDISRSPGFPLGLSRQSACQISS